MSSDPDPGPRLAEYLKPGCDAMLESLERLVELESPSRDKAALDAPGSVIASRFEALGGSTSSVWRIAAGGDHLLAPIRPRRRRQAHRRWCSAITTPSGRSARSPRCRSGSRTAARSGPGVFDMKASLVLAEFALDALTTPRTDAAAADRRSCSPPTRRSAAPRRAA